MEAARRCVLDRRSVLQQIKDSVPIHDCCFVNQLQGDAMSELGRDSIVLDFDRPQQLRCRLEEYDEIIEYALQVIYGAQRNERGGVYALLGARYADVLYARYLDCRTWDKCASTCQISRTSAWQAAQTALAYIDANGQVNTIKGIEMPAL